MIGIGAEACGLGLQDLLVILFFSINRDYTIVLIEEPESHLHPDMQRKLLYFLREHTSKQFFLTTHSNVFLNDTLVDRVFFTRFEESVQVDDATARAAILNDLGYAVTDNLVSDLVILIEGPSDAPIIKEFLAKMDLPSSYDIKVWPLGGDIMDQLDLSVFVQSYNLIALIDNDPGSRSVRERFIENCIQYGIEIHKLDRYAIENYFSLRALKEVFHSQIPSTITTINPTTKLEEQIKINVKKNNRKLAEVMTLSEIEGTDLYTFFNKVAAICKANK
jgi:AAA domain, putative AbiEii toxin, Type IV TA system